MRCILPLFSCLLVAACARTAQDAAQERRTSGSAESPHAVAPAIPSATPDQGTVTKALGGATVAPHDQGQAPGDIAITAAIRKALMADAMLSVVAQDVTVNTVNGTVVLHGTVESAAQRSRIEILARDASGPGSAIDNELDFVLPH